MTRIKIIVLALLVFSSVSLAGDVYFLSLDDFSVDLRGGYTGNFWSPKGLGPFEVDTYGRSMLYGELAVNHPLLFLGEAFDVMSLPRLRIESNFGYSEQNGSLREIVPGKFAENPYLKTTSWITFLSSISVRYRKERFDAVLTDPRYWNATTIDPNIDYVRNVENSIEDFEIGFYGSPQGEYDESLLEVGYYRSTMVWPLLRYQPNSTTEFTLSQEKIDLEGFYIALNTEAVEPIWPLYTQFILRLGGVLGVDARLQFERNATERLRIGVDFDYSWRMVTYTDKIKERFTTPSDLLVDESPRDTRVRATLYTAFRVF